MEKYCRYLDYLTDLFYPDKSDQIKLIAFLFLVRIMDFPTASLAARVQSTRIHFVLNKLFVTSHIVHFVIFVLFPSGIITESFYQIPFACVLH